MELGSSVEVISSARAHLRHRSTSTETMGCVESMLCLTDDVEDRSESEDEYDEAEDVEVRYETCGRADIVMCAVWWKCAGQAIYTSAGLKDAAEFVVGLFPSVDVGVGV